MAVEEGIVKFGTVRSVGGESIVAQRVVFSRDSKIAFCCCGRRIRVYSTATGDFLRDLNGHEKNVTDLKVNPRNHLQLVSCSLDGVVMVWDYTDSSILQKYIFQSCLIVGLLLHYAHDGSIFLITGRKSIKKKKRKDKKQAHAEKLVVFNTKEWKEGIKNLDTLLETCGNSKKCALSGKGDLLASVKEDCLYLWDFNTKNLKCFTYSNAIFTCAAFHPFEPCVAAGDRKGRIILWQGLDQLETPVTMILHWHSHPVGDVSFTYDGSSVLSGGEESVFVLWQYKTDHRQFLPRLGAHISHITVSSDDSLIAVCQKDNVIRLISNIEWKVKCSIQGLRQMDSSSVGIFDPRSRALVMNSMPGILQFYMPQDDRHAFSLDVVKQNYVAKTEHEKLYFADITQAAFNDDGGWLATVERRDDKHNAVEMQLKFWEYNKSSQSYGLNTCVDKSNNSNIVAIQFQPQQGEKAANIPLLMTASTDGKFEIWILAKEELVKDKKYAWTCRSVGYYGDMPCQDAAFSEDGSVLAVAYSQAITLWTPDTNELKKILSLPYPEEEIKSIKFGNHASSQYLICTTKSFLTVWNLLSCSVSWSVQANVSCLLADPQTNLIHVFSLFSDSKCHLYVFDPASPCPVAVQSEVLMSPVMIAAFDPGSSPSCIKDGAKFKMSKLYFMNKDQELFTLDCGDVQVEEKSTTGDLVEEASEQQSDFFSKMFGSSVVSKGESSSVPRTGKRVIGTPSSVVVRQMLSTPSHVLPSVSSLCSTFLLSLMVSKQTSQKENERDDEDDSDMEDETMEMEEDSEPETIAVAETPSVELTGSAVSRRENRNVEEHIDLESVNFEWLQDYFTSS